MNRRHLARMVLTTPGSKRAPRFAVGDIGSRNVHRILVRWPAGQGDATATRTPIMRAPLITSGGKIN